MNDSIDNYINKSKKNLNTIIKNLESNIEFIDNNLWNYYDDISDNIKNIVDIYYSNYYLYVKNDFDKINKYINFGNKINRKLKIILMSIIDYYESIEQENIIKEKESSILYLTILIYISLVLYDRDFKTIDTPKKIEKVINKTIDKFAKIRFKNEKDLISLVNNIKDVIIKNNEFNNSIKYLSNNESFNSFISINNDNKFYKVIYEYNIKKLDQYEEKDIILVNNNMNINSIFTSISYDLCYYTMFKMMRSGIDSYLLFPIRKIDLMNEEIRSKLLNKNEFISKRIKFLVNYDEIKDDYEFVNLMKEKDIDIYIEVSNAIETNNYNMFMDIKNIIVLEEFININEKYVEIWKDMGMNFVIKNLGIRLLEENLLTRK